MAVERTNFSATRALIVKFRKFICILEKSLCVTRVNWTKKTNCLLPVVSLFLYKKTVMSDHFIFN